MKDGEVGMEASVSVMVHVDGRGIICICPVARIVDALASRLPLSAAL